MVRILGLLTCFSSQIARSGLFTAWSACALKHTVVLLASATFAHSPTSSTSVPFNFSQSAVLPPRMVSTTGGFDGANSFPKSTASFNRSILCARFSGVDP